MKNLFLYISAFIPMYLLIIVEIIVEIINNNLSFNVLNSLNLCMLLILTILGVVGIIWSIVFNHDKPIEIIILSKTNITDQHFLGYFSLFVLFSLSFDLSKISMFVVFIIILVLIGVVYIKNDLYYINPFLNILGYNFYDITYKVKGSDKLERDKIFFKGNLDIASGSFKVKFKNNNFNFLSNKKQWHYNNQFYLNQTLKIKLTIFGEFFIKYVQTKNNHIKTCKTFCFF